MSTPRRKSSTLWGIAEQAAERYPERLMVRDEHGFSATFSDFLTLAAMMAGHLYAKGLRPGDTVCWQLPSQVRTLTLMVALSRLGVRQVPLITHYRGREITFITEQIRPSYLIVPGVWRGEDYTARAEESIRAGTRVLPLPDLRNLQPAAVPGPGHAYDSDDWVFYTSGTTGNPRGAMHETVNFVAGAECWTERVGVRPSDCLTINFPVAHVGGICYLLVSLLSGCSIACTETFGQELFEFYADCGVTLAAAGTVFHQAFLRAQQAAPDKSILPKVRAFVGGGAPKPYPLHFDLKRAFAGIGIVSGYGMTEGMMLSMNRLGDEDEKLARSEGRPGLGVDMRIVRKDGSLAPPCEIGEIRVKSPTMFSGYVDPELTAQAYDDSGYVRTGDLGYLDEDGYLVIAGRSKDVIIRKGETLDAKEIEDVLSSHPEIEEAAVVGIADEQRGELVCAALVVTAAAAQDDQEAVLGRILAHLRDSGLMRQKIPERFEFFPVLPRNPTGKVLKQELRTWLLQKAPG